MVERAGAIADLESILTERRVRRVLLVTGRYSYRASGAEAGLAPAFAERTCVRFHDFAPNPTLADVERGMVAWDAVRPDAVIAVGGGSVIDAAKAVNLLAVQDAQPAVVMRQPAAIVRRPPPVIAVPTTAGSGSEATSFATIYIEGVKHSLAHDWLRPAVAVVDPELTYALTPRLTAITGLDALSQAVESYWAVAATAGSQALAVEAIRCLRGALPAAVTRPDAGVRVAVARGAHLAGRAIALSRTTAPHAVSYGLTACHGIPHGHAVALTLGAFIEHNARRDVGVNDPRGADYVGTAVETVCRMLGFSSPREARDGWRDLVHSLGLETSLTELGVQNGDIEGLVAGVNAERMGNNPVPVPTHDLTNLLASLS